MVLRTICLIIIKSDDSVLLTKNFALLKFLLRHYILFLSYFIIFLSR